MSHIIAAIDSTGTQTWRLNPALVAATSPYLVPLDPYLARMFYWQPKKLSRKERRHGRNTRAYQRKTRLWWLANSYFKLPEER